jgi:hypothetical protein
MVAIVACVVVIFILLIVLIFKIAGNSTGSKNDSQTGTNSHIEESYDSREESSYEDSVTGQDSSESLTDSTVQDSEASDGPESSEDSTAQNAGTATYTVETGDTLYSICMNVYGRADNEIYVALAGYNGFEIDDPDDFVIYPDQVLKTPSLAELGLE